MGTRLLRSSDQKTQSFAPIKSRLDSREFELTVSPIKLVLYDIERAIGHAFFRRRPRQTSERLLNLGCGTLLYKGWVNADEYSLKRMLTERDFRPDWRLDITRPWKCEANHWDGIFTQHVVEHLSYSQASFVFEECFRTLKPGGWLRVSVPGIRKYVDYYEGQQEADDVFGSFPYRALAISHLAQMHLHKSTWDGELMCALLRETGFVNATEVDYMQGSESRLLLDQDVKECESLYVEAQKPLGHNGASLR